MPFVPGQKMEGFGGGSAPPSAGGPGFIDAASNFAESFKNGDGKGFENAKDVASAAYKNWNKFYWNNLCPGADPNVVANKTGGPPQQQTSGYKPAPLPNSGNPAGCQSAAFMASLNNDKGPSKQEGYQAVKLPAAAPAPAPASTTQAGPWGPRSAVKEDGPKKRAEEPAAPPVDLLNVIASNTVATPAPEVDLLSMDDRPAQPVTNSSIDLLGGDCTSPSQPAQASAFAFTQQAPAQQAPAFDLLGGGPSAPSQPAQTSAFSFVQQSARPEASLADRGFDPFANSAVSQPVTTPAPASPINQVTPPVATYQAAPAAQPPAKKNDLDSLINDIDLSGFSDKSASTSQAKQSPDSGSLFSGLSMGALSAPARPAPAPTFMMMA